MFDKLFTETGLSLDRLRTFCAVADAGGVTKAARRNPNKQSQFSRQINELEEFFGVELMTRDSKGVNLTAAGQRLLSIGREIFTTLSDFKLECEQQPYCFSVGAGDALLQWLLFPHVGALQQALPELSIEVHGLPSLEIVQRVDDGRLDFGLVRKDAARRGQKSHPIGREDYSLFVPRHLISDSRRSFHEVLTTVPLATIAGEGNFRATLERQSRNNKLPLKIALCCSTFPQVVRALRSEQFAAILPNIAADDLEIDRYLQLPVPFLKGREICLIWDVRTMKRRPKLVAAKDCLTKLLKLSKNGMTN